MTKPGLPSLPPPKKEPRRVADLRMFYTPKKIVTAKDLLKRRLR